MTTLPDVSNLSPSEVAALMSACAQRLEKLRLEHIAEAELLGLTCALPAAKQRKPRRIKEVEQDNG